MTPDNFYWYASVLIFLPWVLLIVAPRQRFTEPVAFAAAVILLVAAAVFTFSYLRSGPADGGHFLSLSGLQSLFRSTEMLLTGWLNYLSFSLLVGTWQSHDARQQRIPHLVVVPCLLLTLLAGPTGLLAYLLVRAVRTRKWSID